MGPPFSRGVSYKKRSELLDRRFSVQFAASFPPNRRATVAHVHSSYRILHVALSAAPVPKECRLVQFSLCGRSAQTGTSPTGAVIL